jgi:hypothetical protein
MVVSVVGYEIANLIFTIIIIGFSIMTTLGLIKREKNGR